MAANEALLLEIIQRELGFDIPEIQAALIATGNKSADAAVEYLLNQQDVGTNVNNNISNNQNYKTADIVTASDIEALKREIQKMNLGGLNLTTQIMEEALKKNRNNKDAALSWLLDNYSSQSPNNNQKRLSQSKLPTSGTSTSAQTAQNKPQSRRSSQTNINVNQQTNVPSQSLATINTSNIDIRNVKDAEALKKLMKEEAEAKKIQQMEEEKRKQLQLQEQVEELKRQEKLKEQKRIEHEKRVEENRKMLEEKKKMQEKGRQEKLLEWHKRHDQYDAHDDAVQQEVKQNRSKLENTIKNPQEAIQTLFDRYGEHQARQTLELLKKIVENIIKDPTNEKYRRINCENRNISANIMTPLGAIAFLKMLGFETEEKQDAVDIHKKYTYLVLTQNPNMGNFQQALKMIEKNLEFKETAVVGAVNKAKNELKIPYEDLWCAIVSLQEIIRNLCISPNSEHLRYVNLDDTTFHNRIGRFPIFIDLLLRLGYKEEKEAKVHGRHLVFEFNDKIQIPLTSPEHPQIEQLKAAVRDLFNCANEILPLTPIAQCVTQLRTQNSNNPQQSALLEQLFSRLLKMVDMILDEPLQTKYHKINVDTLKSKFPNVIGIVSIIKLLGFIRYQQNIPANEIHINENNDEKNGNDNNNVNNNVNKSNNDNRVIRDSDGQIVATAKTVAQYYDISISDLDLLRLRRCMLQNALALKK